MLLAGGTLGALRKEVSQLGTSLTRRLQAFTRATLNDIA